MIVVVATTPVAPESVEGFRALAAEQVLASRQEDGCVHYSCSESAVEPGVFHWIEIWRDLAAFNAHAEAPHHLEYLRVLGDGSRVRRAGPASAHYFDADPLDVASLVDRGFSRLAVPNTVPDTDGSRG